MARTTLAIAAMVLAAGAGSARADGWAWGLSIGLGFPIGDCGWGGISVGIPIGGYGNCYRPYSDPWPYYGGSVCSPAYYRPACERPYNGGWNGAAYAGTRASDEPTRVAAAPPPPPVRRVETEPEAWKALSSGDDAAMEIFARLMARSQTAGTPEIGYAICAAQAGQLDRAEWAAGLAMRADDGVWTKIPDEAAIKDAAASALVMVHDSTKHAQLAGLLRRVAGGVPISETAITAAPVPVDVASPLAAK